ncbi:MAG: hypothetical protein AB2A00_30525 [Myxococcota bacterium]
MKQLTLGDLSIDVDTAAPGAIHLRWRGRSNNQNPATTLQPFLELQLAHARQRGVRVEMHFEELTYFNSSTIAVLLHGIQEAHARTVPLVLHYDRRLRWQAHNFEALRVLQSTDDLLRLDGGAGEINPTPRRS